MPTPRPSESDRRRTEVTGALAALKRARLRAEEIAAATGTALIFWRDGKTVRVEPGAKVGVPSETSKPPK